MEKKSRQVELLFFLCLGGLYLVSYGLNTARLPLNVSSNSGDTVSKQDISISGSSISATNKLQAFCDLASLEQFKKLHLSKMTKTDNVFSSTTPPTPK